MIRTITVLALIWAFALSWTLSGTAEGDVEALSVIVHPGVPVTTLSAADVRSIYRRETSYWPNGEAIRPLALPPENPIRQQFDQAVLGLDHQAVAKFWIDQRVRGGATAPRTVASTALIARVVPVLTGSIAYLPESAVPSGVRVVATIRGGTLREAEAQSRHLVGLWPEREGQP